VGSSRGFWPSEEKGKDFREKKEKGENKRKVKKRNLTSKVWKIWTPQVQVKYMNLIKKIIELSIKWIQL